MAASDDVYKAAMKYRKRLLTLEKKAREEIRGVYGNVLREIDPWVKAYYKRRDAELAAGIDPHDAGGVANREKVQLIRSLERELQAASAPLADTTARAQADALEIANGQAFKLAQIGAPDPVEVRVHWRRPSYEALANLVGFAGDGRPLDTYFRSKLPSEGAKAVQEALYMSTLLNEAPKVAAKRINGAVAGNAWRAETIARTEILRTHRETTRQNYDENDDVVLGYQWLAARDSRSCIVCWMLSGKIFKNKEPFGTHVNCRCSLVPITDPEDLLEAPKGDAEFKALPVGEQRDILGDPKFFAWQEGKLKLENLIGFKKHPIFGPIRWERGLKDALKGEVPGAIPPQPKTLKPAPKKRAPKAPEPEASKIPAPPVEPREAPSRPKNDFPWDTELPLLKPVRKLGGTTGAELVEDERGNQWVKKRGASPEHLRSEVAADQIYRALGVRAPEAKLYETKDGPIKLARFIEGTPLSQLTGRAQREAHEALRQDFAADALLGNWDVIGDALDNILVDNRGDVWRIDNGGALKFRAQGDLKKGKDAFGIYPRELWSMRDDAINPNLRPHVKEIYGKLGAYELQRQLLEINVLDTDTDLRKKFPPDVKAELEGRLKEFENLRGHLEGMKDDGWLEHYADEVSYHALNLRQEGVIDKLPKEFKQGTVAQRQRYDPDPEVIMYDENGEKWDKLRAAGQAITAIHDYFDQNNLRIKTISEWQDGQAGSSWSEDALAFKWLLQKKVKKDTDYFWLGSTESRAQYEYDGVVHRAGGEDAFRKAHAAYKALTLEFLGRVKFKNNDIKKKSMELKRTEGVDALIRNNFRLRSARKEEGTMQRLAYDSFSAFTKVTVGGSELTIQTVPHASIHGLYFFYMDKNSNPFQSGFATDNENEIVATHHRKKLEWRSR